MAVVFERTVNHMGKPCRLYTHSGQACGQPKPCIHVTDGSGNVAGTAQAHGVCHFFKPLLALHGICLRIKAHHCG